VVREQVLTVGTDKKMEVKKNDQVLVPSYRSASRCEEEVA